MSNKTANLQNIPLSGTLNVSKNKTDIVAPGTPMHLDNDGVLYGNTLSPIYKKSLNQNAEYYDKSGNYYDVGSSTLNKNGSTKINFTNKHFETETLSLQHVDSILKDGNNLYRTEINGSTFKFYSSNGTYTPQDSIATVFASRVITPTTCMLFFETTTGTYIIRCVNMLTGGTPSLDSFTVTPTNIGSPVIFDYKRNESGSDVHYVTVCTDSGVNTKADTYAYRVTFGAEAIGIESVTPTPTTENIEVQYNLDDIFNVTGFYTPTEKGQYGGQVTRVQLKQSFVDSEGTNLKNIYFGVKVKSGGTVDINTLKNWNCDDDYNWYLSKKLKMNDYVGDTEIGETLSSNVAGISVASTNQSGFGHVVWSWIENPPMTFSPYASHAAVNPSEEADSLVMFVFENAYFNGGTGTLYLKAIPNYLTQGDPDTGKAKPFSEMFKSLYYKDGQGNWVEYDKDYISYMRQVTTTYDADCPCNAILDDGTFICLREPKVAEVSGEAQDYYKQGTYAFTGTFDSYDSTNHKVKYNFNSVSAVVLGQQRNKAAAYPYKPSTLVISLGWNYFRSSLISLGGDEETKTQLLYDSAFNKVYVNPGYNTSTLTNGKGSIATKGNWRVLYNNNLLSGISYSENAEEVGTLLTDWNTISKILFISENDCYYINNNNKVVHISVVANGQTAPDFQVFQNRFIIINTTSYYNCYDILNDEELHFAPDYNNRFQEGIVVYNYLKQNNTNTEMLLKAKEGFVDAFVDASGFNVSWARTSNPIIGAAWAMEVLSNVFVDKFNRLASKSSDGIDYYRGIGKTTATYVETFINGIEKKNVLLEDADYPIDPSGDMLYNPPLLVTFIETYNRKDMVLNKGDNTAYPLISFNGNNMMAYYMLNGLENAENVFVIQTLIYTISGSNIMEVYYDGDKVSTYQAIANIDGMQYLGQLPTEALFWSPMNRSIYSFAGDAILRQVFQWNEIKEIEKTFYNTQTHELFLICKYDNNTHCVICISENHQYRVNGEISNIWFENDYMVVKQTVSNATSDYEWRYEYKAGYNDSTVVLTTTFLGSPENKVSHYDCVYFRLHKNRDFTGSLTFKVKATTLTDMGKELDEKTFSLSSTDFDEETDSIYLRYQQAMQTGVATKYEITSPFPIISITLGYNELDQTAMISHVNI